MITVFRMRPGALVAKMGSVDPPAFVRIEALADHRQLVTVSMTTDITDAAFLQEFTRAVETMWRGHGGQDELRLRVDVDVIPPERLYFAKAEDAGKAAAPSWSGRTTSRPVRWPMNSGTFPDSPTVMFVVTATWVLTSGSSICSTTT